MIEISTVLNILEGLSRRLTVRYQLTYEDRLGGAVRPTSATGALEARIAQLFEGLAAVSVWDESLEPELYPGEEAAVRRAVEKRKLEFARGRACSRAALTVLGVEPGPILVGEGREPLWPEGVVGSITHCDGLVAAAVARTRRIVALGLDAEPARRLPAEARDLILHPSETSADPAKETSIFCAKEAVYKAIFPLTRVWMEFLDVEIELDELSGTFRVHPWQDRQPPEQIGRLQGRLARTTDHVIAGCFVER